MSFFKVSASIERANCLPTTVYLGIFDEHIKYAINEKLDVAFSSGKGTLILTDRSNPGECTSRSFSVRWITNIFHHSEPVVVAPIELYRGGDGGVQFPPTAPKEPLATRIISLDDVVQYKSYEDPNNPKCDWLVKNAIVVAYAVFAIIAIYLEGRRHLSSHL